MILLQIRLLQAHLGAVAIRRFELKADTDRVVVEIDQVRVGFDLGPDSRAARHRSDVVLEDLGRRERTQQALDVGGHDQGSIIFRMI